MHLFAPSGFVCHVCLIIRIECLCLWGHHGWQQTWSQSQQISIQLHQTDRQIGDTSLQPQQHLHWLRPGGVILDGYYSKHRLPKKWSRLVVRNESELVSALCPSALPPQWCHHRHIPRHPLPFSIWYYPPSAEMSLDASSPAMLAVFVLFLSLLAWIRDRDFCVWIRVCLVCTVATMSAQINPLHIRITAVKQVRNNASS